MNNNSFAVCMVVAVALAGCESLAVTAFGVGASTGVSQTINGTIDRTFTYPERRVRAAAETGLKTMGIEMDSADGDGPIHAHARGRQIEISFEALSASSTRMRVVAKSRDWFYYDAATGREIVVQTEKALAEAPALPMTALPTAETVATPTINPVDLEAAPTLVPASQ